MKIIGINGSHRTENNSGKLLTLALDKCQTNGHQVSLFNLHSLHIECLGCEHCYEDAFYHKDDLVSLYKEMIDADVFIFSTPTHFGMPSVRMKILMDRADALRADKKFRGKIGAVITNGAAQFGGIEMCAYAIMHYFHDCKIHTPPVYVCVNNTLQYERHHLPDDLPIEIISQIEKLVSSIENMKSLRSQT